MHNFRFQQILYFSGITMAFSSCGESRQTEQQKPNVIFILADDLGYGDLSCLGQKHFSTPNIDRLAKEGMTFTSHYSGSPVCAPSRAVLMTGIHTGRNPIRGNARLPLPDSCYTVAELFKDAGYSTGAFGKWGLGFPEDEGYTGNQGFDLFFGYHSQSLAHRYYPVSLFRNREEIMLNNKDSLREYAADLIHNEALKFISGHKDSSFFLYLPYIIPHAELLVPEDSIINNFRGKFLPEKTYKGNDYFSEDFRPNGYASQMEGHATFAAMVTRLDMYVGQILDLIDSLGLSENTLIFFSSDNGPHQEGGADPGYFRSSGPFRGIKRDLYDGGIRLPLLARWPGKIPAGVQTDILSGFQDFLPSMAALTGIKIPGETDGISLLPVLMGQDQAEEHDYLYWEFHEQGGKQAVRKGKWKAVRLNVNMNENAPVELYDLETDPGETIDIAGKYPEMVSDMEEIMKKEHVRELKFLFEHEKH